MELLREHHIVSACIEYCLHLTNLHHSKILVQQNLPYVVNLNIEVNLAIIKVKDKNNI